MLAELVLAGLALGAAGIFMVGRRFSRAALLALGVSWAIASASLAWFGSRYWDPNVLAGERAISNRPIALQEDDYVSSDTCRSCHPREYATWQGSYHRSMTQVASPATVIPDFDGVELEAYGRRYSLERRGDEFWVDQEGIWEPGRPPRVQKPVVLTTGSHHYQLFWLPTERSRKLELFQFAYRIDQQRWMNVDNIFLFPPDVRQVTEAKGHWNHTCSQCHAALPKPRIAGSEMDTQVAEFGIACEACHGPGRKHIEANRSPIRRLRQHWSPDPDPTIVQPEHLDPDVASHVCGQCHGIFEHRDRSRLNSEGVSYRPGDDLNDHREMQLAGEANKFWSDGMARTSGRDFIGLANSPCFNHGDESREVMTCMSCHGMHQPRDDPRPMKQWADDQLKLDMQGDAACLQCHPEFTGDAATEAHTWHTASSEGSRCYNCHMPHTTYGLLKAIRSHTVSSPSAQESLETGRPNACNLCHLDETLEWTSDQLEARYGFPGPELSEEQRRVSAAVLWLLRGDAGQRALIAWSMGWEPARQASGTEWLAPFLGQLLSDPYAANRFIAHRSLRRIPGFADFAFDEAASPDERAEATRRVRRLWDRRNTAEGTGAEAVLIDRAGRSGDKAVLIDGNGALQEKEFKRILGNRDDRRVGLVE